MNRLFFLLLTLSVATASAEQPNILFIGVDDLRPELGCYGATHMQTPHIDLLARQGVRFDHAYCQQAVCLPSRISLFTGMRPDSTGVHDLNTHFRDTIPDVVTLTQLMGKSGYRTIGTGKVYHDEQPAEWDEWYESKEREGVSEYHLPEILNDIRRREKEAKEKGLKRKALRQYTKGPSVESANHPDSEYEDAAITDIAIESMSTDDDRPFFMMVGYHKPHLPLVAPKKYWDLYERENVQLPENYFLPKKAPKIALSTWGELRAYSDIPKDGPLTDDKAREIIHGYYASISFVDAQIGRLLTALKSKGLDRNTVVVLWSDHGWKLGEHAMWCKHTNFDIDARVPLIIRQPGNEATDNDSSGKSSDAMVELVDLYPTICELAGITIPSSCEGKSLVGLLGGQSDPQWRKHAFSQYKRSRKTGGDIIGYSAKVPSGRYTEWINIESRKVQAVEYYDHSQDPDENSNAAKELGTEDAKALSAIINSQFSDH